MQVGAKMDANFRRPRKQRLMAQMNVVPYIDVMLVLLVIFMVTAPMLTQGLKVDLPVAASDPMTLKQNPPIIISIEASGRLWMRVGDGPEQTVRSSDLVARLQSAQSDAENTQVLINGDQHIAYGKVVALMSALQQAGVHDVGLLTQLEDSH